MSLKLGTNTINKIYLGANEIKKAYLGANLIYDKTAPTNGLLNNLVSYYKMDTNGSFPDAHGSNNGTINGASYTASGKINGGYSFDGVNDYVDFNAYTVSTVSISLWVRFDNLSGQRALYSTIAVSPVRLIEFRTNGDKIQLGVNDGTFYSTQGSTTLSTGVFYHITGSYNSITGDTKIYLNGTLEASSTIPTGLTFNGTTDINIGCYNSGFRFTDGIIDEVGIWSKEISLTDAETLYNSGAGLSYDNFTT